MTTRARRRTDSDIDALTPATADKVSRGSREAKYVPVTGESASRTAADQVKQVPVNGKIAAKIAEDRIHAYVAVQRRGTVALPPALRRRYRLDEPGAQVEITEREDGVLELRPLVAVPACETWFWTERWQAGEREVDAHIVAGEVTEHASGEDFLAHLDALDAE